MIMVEVTVLLKGFSFGCLGECNQSRVFDAYTSEWQIAFAGAKARSLLVPNEDA